MAGSSLWGILVGGGGDTTQQIVETAVDYTTVPGDDVVIGTAVLTVTLHPLANAVKSITIKSDGPGALVTVEGDGSETIEGNPDYRLTPGTSITLTPTASEWVIV